MSVALESNAFFWGIEYLATFCCGMCGGLAAVRKGYDIFAILVTTWLTALGGGIIRDVLLGIAPPVGVSDKGLVIVALLASVLQQKKQQAKFYPMQIMLQQIWTAK